MIQVILVSKLESINRKLPVELKLIMNLSSHQDQKTSISFPIDRNTLEEKRVTPGVEWIRVAPNKIIVASLDSSWLLEDHDNFHFTQSK
ncbi:MAG: hypothetical protein AAF383_21395 [Cyanobacteria bacterium P01_A01_bin.83]